VPATEDAVRQACSLADRQYFRLPANIPQLHHTTLKWRGIHAMFKMHSSVVN
jgi:hypothetical protein